MLQPRSGGKGKPGTAVPGKLRCNELSPFRGGTSPGCDTPSTYRNRCEYSSPPAGFDANPASRLPGVAPHNQSENST